MRRKTKKGDGKISNKIIFSVLDSQSEIEGKFKENYVDTSYMPIGSVLFTRDGLVYASQKVFRPPGSKKFVCGPQGGPFS